MATKTLRVFAEYTSTGFVPMPTAGNIDYGYTLGSTFPATTPTSFQTDNPDLVVTVTAMTDFYVWIRINGTAWNPSYTRNVRVYPDSPNINNVVMNMIIATGPAGVSSYTQIVQTSNRLYFNGATTDSIYNSKFAGKTYINELNFGTAPGLATVATSGAYADLTGKPSLATVATSGLFTDLSSKPSGTAPLSYNSGTNSFVITQANTSTNGYLSSTDWNTFNNKFSTPAGTTLQYVDGTGALQTFPLLASADKLVINVRNSSGVSMPKGSVVYINGATGNKPTVALSQGNSDATSAQTLGLLQTTLANNAEGNVVIVGSVIDLNTSAFTEGQQLYLSPTTAGAYTTTKPYAPSHLVYVGVVTRSHVSLGTIEVKVQNGYEMDELHDVSAQSPSNNDGLFYNTTTSLWEKKSIATVLGYTPYNGTNTSIKALFSASAPLSYSDGAFSISQASASTNGYLSSTDWNTFNNKGSGSGTVTSVAMTVPTELSISGTPITTSGTLALSLTAGYIIPTTANVAQWENAYTNRITSLTLNGSSGTATLASNVLNIPSYTLIGLGGQPALSGTGFVKISGTTISYDNSSYLPSTGGIMTSSIGFADSGKRGIYGTMGGNDSWFIGAGATATNSGYIEISTGDDATEPIYVRQYNGDPYTTGTVARTATLLDGSGNTIFPNTLTATTLVKSGGTSSQYLMADGSVSTITNNITGTGTINELAYFNTSSTVASLAVATYPSLTELAYVKGVTSAIQTQLNAKASALSGTTNYHAKFTSSTTIGDSLIFDNGTNIGIGTASPSYSLEVKKTGTDSTIWGYNIAQFGDATANNNGLRVGTSTSVSGLTNLVAATASAASQFAFWTFNGSAWGERVRLNSTGLVGIGTNAPSQALHLSSASSVYCRIVNTAGADVYLGSESTQGVLSVSNNLPLDVRTNNTTRLLIASTGRLTVSGPTTFLDAWQVGSTGQYLTATYSTGLTYLYSGSGQKFFLSVNGSYSAGIVIGSNICIGSDSDNGSKLLVSGSIYATGNITANSDLTLKKNLQIIDNPIDKLMQLNGYSYQWKSDDSYQYGVVAQEVEKILPYAAFTGTDGIKGVSYNQLTPLLIEGFKGHESEITILKARVKYLESKLA